MPLRGAAPNIVYIVLDQWRGDCLGIADSGHPAMTPHFDQLAHEGIWYRRAYADCPVCMPQRATMLTGFTGSQHGMPRNFMTGPRTPIDPRHSLPHRLSRERGYHTKAVGKMHFYPERARFGFDDISLFPNDYVNFLEAHGYGGFYRGHGLGGNEVYPVFSAVPERLTHTHWIVDEGIDFLQRRDPDGPFMLWLVFEAPHSPFDPPQEYAALYDKLDPPEPVIGDWVGDADEPRALIRQRLMKKIDRLPPQVLQQSRRHYYAQITHIDYQLGRLLGELKRQGVYDNTIIVVTSDHGEHLGDHQLVAKSSFLESSARVPIILRLPGADVPRNRVDDAPVLTADIAPTLLRLAGLQPDDAIDGCSLLDLPAERHIFGEAGDTIFATDGRYKYIYYFDGAAEQLFDVLEDADDVRNLAKSADHFAIKAAFEIAVG